MPGASTAELRDIVPASLAPLCRSMVVAGDDPQPNVAAIDAGAIERALASFGAGFWQPDAQAVASLWSMYYFNALIVPPTVALLGCDRILPVALAATGLTLDAKGAPERFAVRDIGRPATEADRGRRFATLVDGHLVPLVAMLSNLRELSPRLLWSNAATVLDYALSAVAGLALAEPRAEAEALLAGAPGSFPHLADPFRTATDGARERKICCMRHRLSGVAPCPTICPGRDTYMGIGGEGARRRGPDDAGSG